jgi:hypothetical protein
MKFLVCRIFFRTGTRRMTQLELISLELTLELDIDLDVAFRR